MFLTRLSLAIQASGNIEESKYVELKKLSSKEASTSDDDNTNEEDQEKMRSFIIQILRDKDALMILDGCEDPLEDDGKLFVSQLDFLLDACPTLKLLLTSRKYVNALEHNQEMPYHLYSLSPQASIKLLLSKAPRPISNDEIQELLEFKIPTNHMIRQHFPTVSTGEITLTNHPFTLMLGGHPQAVCLAAPMLETQTLLELFQQMLESNIMDALEHTNRHTYASLRISIDISIKNLNKNEPRALNLFKFIGLLPAGVNQNDLTEMWGNNDWKSYKESLIKASLVVFKPAEQMLTLLPFMNTRAYELLEEDGYKLKMDLHLKCCKFYRDYCEKRLALIDQNQFDLNEFVEKEPNIWACIYRSTNRKKDNNEYDEENENSKLLLAQSFRKNNISTFKDLTYKPNNAFGRPLLAKPPMLSSKKKDISAIQEDTENERSNNNSIMGSRQPSSKPDTSDKREMTDSETYAQADKYSNLQPSRSRTSSYENQGAGQRFQNTVVATRLNNKIKSRPSKEDKEEQNKSEEMLVIYYVATVIRLSKLSDGLKAISEYMKKPFINKLAMAHLYKLEGVIHMLSEQKDFEKAIACIEKAIKLFDQIDCMKGWAI